MIENLEIKLAAKVREAFNLEQPVSEEMFDLAGELLEKLRKEAHAK